MRLHSFSAICLAGLCAARTTGSPDAVAKSLFEAGASNDRRAFQASWASNLEREDEVLLGTFFELLSVAPVEVGWPEEPYVNRDRALVPATMRSVLDDASASATSWMWLVREDGRWRVRRLEEDARYSREWLYEQPKEGLAGSPAEAASVLFAAMTARDTRAAERASSDLAWEGTEEGLASLAKLARDLGLAFAVEEPRVTGDRAVVPFGLAIRGQRQRDALLYVERVGAGWIATGIDHDEEHSRQFLQGRSAATRSPRSPFVALDMLVDSVGALRDVRARRMVADTWDGVAWVEQLLRARRRGVRLKVPRSSIQHEGTRCFARLEIMTPGASAARTILVMLEERPEGWRIVGETEVPDIAEAFLAERPGAR